MAWIGALELQQPLESGRPAPWGMGHQGLYIVPEHRRGIDQQRLLRRGRIAASGARRAVMTGGADAPLALADGPRVAGHLAALKVDRHRVEVLVELYRLAEQPFGHRIAVGLQMHIALGVDHPMGDDTHRWAMGGQWA